MKFLTFCLTGTLMAAGAFAQTSTANSANNAAPKAPESHTRVHRRSMVDRLSERLSLTADQKMQVRGIFAESRSEVRKLRPQLREEHQALAAAVKSDSEPAIDQITRSHEHLNAEVEAIHAKTMAKVYALLTPDQKAKFDRGMPWMRHGQRQEGGAY